MENKRNAIFSIIIVIVIIWGLYSFLKKDAYIGFYYPDANNLSNDIQSGGSFGSLDECRNWINKQKSTYNPDGTKLDDYECGENCNLQNGQKPYVCEETLE